MQSNAAESRSRWFRTIIAGLALIAVGTNDRTANAGEKEDGFTSLFDGKTLENWDGNPKFWKVEDGAITGQTTKDNPTQGNTFIIWTGGETADFELKLEYRIFGGNSGIQYRSFKLQNAADQWRIGGYQADFEAGDRYSGICYGEKFRGILADRGQKTVIEDNGKPKVVGSVGDSDEIAKAVKKEDWNEYHIIARGFHFVHKINGVTTCELTDEDADMRRAKGFLALQLHAGPSMKVQFKNIRIKHLKGDAKTSQRPSAATFTVTFTAKNGMRVNGKPACNRNFAFHLNKARRNSQDVSVAIHSHANVPYARIESVLDLCREQGVENVKLALAEPADLQPVSTEAKKKVVLIAGRKSHGYGAHEHRAGCLLLANALNESGLLLETQVVTEGWPKDASVLDDADSIVIYCDGGGGHPFNAHIEELDKLMKQGVGLVCIHYGVEVPKGKSGEAFLDWTGGYFETDWSVNPHWTAQYEKFPQHPIANGVRPFSINDEWYYHMRFREQMDGVTPILTDLPPEETLKRPDGAHSNNPFVRTEVLEEKRPQHMAWARERPDGGRGFGFTGGHNHWNWGNDNFRKLVLNAIVWTAKGEVPKNGVPSKSLTVADLEANQDYPQPPNHNPARIQAMLDEWNRESADK